MRPTRIRSLLAALLLAAACSTTGQPIDPDSVTKIKIYESTQDDVRALFGEPSSVSYTGRGRLSWRYVYRERTRRDTGTLTKIGRSISSIFRLGWFFPPVDVAYQEDTTHLLVVLFNADGTVMDYAYERESLPTRKVY